MDRRVFLAGAAASVTVACAAPERLLVTQADLDAVDLDAADRAPATTSASAAEIDDGELSIPPELSIPDSARLGLVLVAEAANEVVTVHDAPRGSVIHTLANPIPSGGPLVFVVDEFGTDGWHRMLLPLRPNGATGWVEEAAVTFSRHNYRILVDLGNFQITAFEHEEPIFAASIGVAADNTPTPAGRYYLTELLQPPVPNSVYGAFAYGLSGYSEVLEEFNGGPGQLGIHGTNDPETIGTKVSSGCIRLHNDDISHMVELGIPLGTPVEVV